MTKRELKWTDLDEFTRAYAECALWASTHFWKDAENKDCEESLDKNHGIEDVATETLEEMVAECNDFREANKELLERAEEEFDLTESSAGHDFWLTRNGHGAGFWDRDLGDVGDKLTKACKPYGEVDLYVGDDGKIYS